MLHVIFQFFGVPNQRFNKSIYYSEDPEFDCAMLGRWTNGTPIAAVWNQM